MLPLEVLQKAQSQMLNYEGSGMSVMEMSHRSKAYDEIITTTQARLRRILNIPDNYKVLFLQGGASSQFSAIPMNLMKNKRQTSLLRDSGQRKHIRKPADMEKQTSSLHLKTRLLHIFRIALI